MGTKKMAGIKNEIRSARVTKYMRITLKFTNSKIFTKTLHSSH